jgi:hypothetical protein
MSISSRSDSGRSARVRDGIVAARHTFAEAGLAEPPIPHRFERRMRVIAPWCFATRTVDPMAMYFFEEYVMEVLASTPRDYVAICHAGHGINSYAINYHLIDGPLAVFAQVGWGGAYDDPTESAQRANDLWLRISRLLAAADAARSRWLARRSGRLVVIESSLRGESAWGWHDRPQRRKAVRSWLEAHSLAEAGSDDPRHRGSSIEEATLWLTAAG